MRNIKKIFYCHVPLEYLEQIFDLKQISDAKLIGQRSRPLLAIKLDDNFSIILPEKTYMILPQKTYHGDDKRKYGRHNFNFRCDEQRYLDVGSLFFAPSKFVTQSIYNDAPANIEKAKEVANRFYVIEKLYKILNNRMETDMSFNKKHSYISKSKQICEIIAEEDKNE
ncbi:MAG: hypothetical protein MJ219_00355 [Mycoplasmoidaceae bacterium]|nr:hypothetical protein [Mycoplasmoidaceae bacterium]